MIFLCLECPHHTNGNVTVDCPGDLFCYLPSRHKGDHVFTPARPD